MPPEADEMQIGCGKCLGCRMEHARAWTLRCTLELHDHSSAAFTTLTYDEKHRPPTLRKRDLQLWLKRLRRVLGTARPIRFFACGEYGEQTARPHYHAILYGASELDRKIVEDTWGLGHTRTEAITPQRIAYTAGYTAKKIGDRRLELDELVDEWGEVYTHQPPFLQMSMQPGIGGRARRFANSWQYYAVLDGTQMKVPRFLHEAWKKQATEEEIEKTQKMKREYALRRELPKTFLEYTQHLTALKKATTARQALSRETRKLTA